MATRGVKITGLNNLDTVNGNIIIPVVDPTITLATPDGETLQSNVNQIGNFILNEAGNLFPTANVANTVKNNAQPNITSVGTLVSLSVSGNTTLGNTVTGNYFIGNLYGQANTAGFVTNNVQSNITSLGTLVNLNVAGVSFLNDVGNIRIAGGNAGQVLHTYGNGFLYWAEDDDAFPGGPNTAVQFNTNGNFDGSAAFTFDTTSNTLTITNLVANNIIGNLGNLIANYIDAKTIDVDTIYIGNFHLQGVGNGTQQQVLGIVDQDTQQLGWKTVPVYYITVEMRDGSNYLSSPDPVLRVYPIGQRDGSYLDLDVTQI